MIILLSVLVMASLGFFLYTILFSNLGEDQVVTRLKQMGYTPEGQVLSVEEQELAKPFTERVLQPIIDRFQERVTRLASKERLEQARLKLMAAGNPMGLEPERYIAIRYGAGIALPLSQVVLFYLCAGVLKIPSSLAWLVALLPAIGALAYKPTTFSGIFCLMGFSLAWMGTMQKMQPGDPVSAAGLILALLLGCPAGFFGPQLWLNGLANKRRYLIQRQLPDVLDLLTVCVEAGLGFDSAMGKVIEKMPGPLAEEFKRVVQEIRLNKPRVDAMRDMAQRVQLEDLTNFVGALIQADQLGASIATSLRVQSEQMRTKRRQRAQEKAQQAVIKLLFPILLFILPTVFEMVFFPLILSFMYPPQP